MANQQAGSGWLYHDYTCVQAGLLVLDAPPLWRKGFVRGAQNSPIARPPVHARGLERGMPWLLLASRLCVQICCLPIAAIIIRWVGGWVCSCEVGRGPSTTCARQAKPQRTARHGCCRVPTRPPGPDAPLQRRLPALLRQAEVTSSGYHAQYAVHGRSKTTLPARHTHTHTHNSSAVHMLYSLVPLWGVCCCPHSTVLAAAPHTRALGPTRASAASFPSRAAACHAHRRRCMRCRPASPQQRPCSALAMQATDAATGAAMYPAGPPSGLLGGGGTRRVRAPKHRHRQARALPLRLPYPAKPPLEPPNPFPPPTPPGLSLIYILFTSSRP